MSYGVLCVKSISETFICGELQELTKKQAESTKFRQLHRYGEKNPLMGRDEILHRCMYSQCNHIYVFAEDRLRGLGVVRDQISGFPTDLCGRSLQQSCTTV